MTYPCIYDLPMSGNDWVQFYAPHNVYHPGIDLNKGYGNSDCGNDVLCPKDGVVEFINRVEAQGRGFGLFVIIKHTDGNYTRYAHLNDIAGGLTIGIQIKEGSLIGHVGKTGTSYCHLHFEVFNEKLAEVQRKHTYKFCFYPSSKTKAWVQEHYLNPWEWLKAPQVQTIPEWAVKPIEKAKAKGIITDWSNPYGLVDSEKLEWILEKAGLLDPAKHEGRVTLVRMAVVLEKLNLLN